jgi:hypothetical protein
MIRALISHDGSKDPVTDLYQEILNPLDRNLHNTKI